ncbi:HAD family hydrolase [Kitasatospora sp. NPDC056184]|uniref:HAD family hydrolase n=1 Tax=Kitasatospora sp. NPDC056184 TaxID=3345738 RepID=UPI0035E1A803
MELDFLLNRTTKATPAPITIVWDWNGTLRNDLDDHVAALNATLPGLGGEPISVETYQALHRMPIRDFYTDVLGRQLGDEEWHAADTAFLAELARRPVRLQQGARQLMMGLRARGVRQSLLSLAPHERLVGEVESVGITGLLERVDGRPGPSVPSKAPAMIAHLQALGPGVDPSRTLVIGDSVDDAVAAHAVGAVPVLHSTGLHGATRLATAGVPLVDTIQDAVATGIAIITSRQPAAA